jgi:hypothetical protein
MSEYLARLSSRYNVFTGEFIQALLLSRENQKANCENLSIECRKKTKTQNTFLIKHGSDVVAQFQVATEVLQEAENSPFSFKHFPDKTRMPNVKKSETAQSYCIRDLRAGMSHVNLKAKVLEITTPKTVNTRYGTIATLAKALIDDETGKIQLCLWNDQAETVSAGDTIVIENARASMFGGKTQLSIGTKGKLSKEASLPTVSNSPCDLPAD